MRASGRLRTALVRERDGDQEHDHNESDRISIKLFPIDVDTHRTALLFAEATMNNKPQLLPLQQRASNARSTAALWVRCSCAVQIRNLETPREVRSHPLLIVGFSMPNGDRFGLAVFTRHVIRFKKRRSGG